MRSIRSIILAATCLPMACCSSDYPAGHQSRADFSREWCKRNGVKYVPRPEDEEHPKRDKILMVAGAPVIVAGYALYGLFWAMAHARSS
jgi:hypothetical protein